MTDLVESAVPDPEAAIHTRRRVLSLAKDLGLAAAGAAALGVADTAQAQVAVPSEPVPDDQGGFGRPPTAEMLRRQLRRSAEPVGSEVRGSPGVARGPDPAATPGLRLRPSGEPVDATPLARRGWDIPRATGRG